MFGFNSICIAVAFLIVTPMQTNSSQTAFLRIETGGDEPKAFIAHVRIK